MNSNSNWHGSDPDVMLCLAVIGQAQQDVMNERTPLAHRRSAAIFFLSEWYDDLVTFVLSGIGCDLWGNGWPGPIDRELLHGLLSETD